jgi:hypothetical protein
MSAEAILGDGIEHVLATSSGDVWVGYFDEGVFGNYGWGGPGPEPIGDHGLTVFDDQLAPKWRFPAYETPWGGISDCYALNVTDDATWTCYYTDFPVVKIHDRTVTGWRNTTAGVRALVTDGDRIALIGGYREERNRVEIGQLSDGEVQPARSTRLALPGGHDLPVGAAIFGRGPELHVVVEDTWYRASLDQLATH